MNGNVAIAVAPGGEAVGRKMFTRLRLFGLQILGLILNHNSPNPATAPDAALVAERHNNIVNLPPPNVDPERPINLHPIIVTVREQELGKCILNLGGPISIALLITSDERSHTVLGHFVLAGLSAGCTSIWIGLAVREAFPESAIILEQAGIVLVLVSFNGFIASGLPMEFAWVPMLCGGLSIATFVVAALPPQN